MLQREKDIEALAWEGKDQYVAAGLGLFVRVRQGSKSWMLRFTSPVTGKRETMSLGTWPKVLMKTAVQLASDAHQLIAVGKDPRQHKLEKKKAARMRDISTFEAVARSWHAHATGLHEWSPSYSVKVLRTLELHAFPRLGKLPIGLIPINEVHDTLYAVAVAGTRETAVRLRESVARTYAFAVTRCILLPSENFMAKGVADMKLPAPTVKHHAAILDPVRVGQLLRDIHAYQGSYITRAAMQLMPLLFQRPGAVRMMEWDQLDLDDRTWYCPPKLMKQTRNRKARGGGDTHVVPLPWQAVAILHELHTAMGHPTTGPVFKSISRRNEDSRFMSENTINAALRSLGYNTQDEITGHGFRAMARTLIHQQLRLDPVLPERHLAHESNEKLKGAYDRGTFDEERRGMIQAWADYLDELARPANRPLSVVPPAIAA